MPTEFATRPTGAKPRTGSSYKRDHFAGVLKKLKCKVGDIVGKGVELAEVEPFTF